MQLNLPYEWEPRQYQIPLWRYMIPVKEHQRAAVAWHRRAGKDLTAINIAACKAFQRRGTYWHMLPYFKQAREIVWDGMTDDGRRFIDHFDPASIKSIHNTEMKIEFINGSIYRLMGADDIDRLVGPNPVGIIMSEYSVHNGYHEVWNYLTPMLMNNGGWAMFLFTVRGRNHAWDTLNNAIEDDEWYGEILVAGDHGTKMDDGTPVMGDDKIERAIKDGMTRDKAEQEFYNSPDASAEGAYYTREMREARKRGQIRRVPIDPMLPVHTTWDIGRDCNAIWFWQTTGREYHMIDYYEVTGEGFPHCKRVLKNKGYDYGRHFGPWDLKVEEWMQAKKSRLQLAREAGLNFRLLRKSRVEDQVENARRIIPMTFFDEMRCKKGIEALRAYQKKKNKRTGEFEKEPLHNWASHGASSFAGVAMAPMGGINNDMTEGANYHPTQEKMIHSTWK